MKLNIRLEIRLNWIRRTENLLLDENGFGTSGFDLLGYSAKVAVLLNWIRPKWIRLTWSFDITGFDLSGQST